MSNRTMLLPFTGQKTNEYSLGSRIKKDIVVLEGKRVGTDTNPSQRGSKGTNEFESQFTVTLMTILALDISFFLSLLVVCVS